MPQYCAECKNLNLCDVHCCILASFMGHSSSLSQMSLDHHIHITKVNSVYRHFLKRLVGPVRLRDVWRCSSMESGEQFVESVGIHWTVKWSVDSLATREWIVHILIHLSTTLVKVQDRSGWGTCNALAVKPIFCSAHMVVLEVVGLTFLMLV